ncbi:uncharacterized protein YgbK (DUF1537 family) [Georgenia soli]|uniref:3-oxo-tetronate kinase n=1 Tax=Georgenia soli TaxID=638953 RepID=A0A2A9EL25_9MICO|nr:3-oxo-tetronate kinase [Georgenia soli]PFG38962.1 uncharacterized protein YgbK (DUF1537 family) [Georgenia soli]
MTTLGPRLGVLADDYTGAVDVAATLQESGVPVELHLGVPPPDRAWDRSEVVVVGLRSRSVDVATAVAWSGAAASWLVGLGTAQLFQKYSSTFDSTDAGNIGPVADALRAALHRSVPDPQLVLFCPAVPHYGRTVYQGHLFVGDRLVSEAGTHPLTPRDDPDLVRRLSQQTAEQVGLLPHQTVAAGVAAARAALDRLVARGVRYVVADAVDDGDLAVLGQVAQAHRLVTGAVGLASALLAGGRELPEPREGAEAPRRSGPSRPEAPPHALPGAFVAGSCTVETLEQVRRFEERWPVLRFRPTEVADGRDVVAEARRLAVDQLADGPVGVAAGAPADVVRAEQEALGRARAAELTERTLGEVAEALVELGVRRLVAAGGETAGAVVDRCGISRAAVGATEAPGIPWLRVDGDGDPLWVLLKSGPLGDPDLLLRALDPAGTRAVGSETGTVDAALRRRTRRPSV